MFRGVENQQFMSRTHCQGRRRPRSLSQLRRKIHVQPGIAICCYDVQRSSIAVHHEDFVI